MLILPANKIPTDISDTPIENLIDLYKIGKELEDICIERKGIGLSAVQTGIPWKFFVYWANYPFTPMQFNYMINCEYKSVNDEKSLSIEGCLSLLRLDETPRMFRINRFRKVQVRGKQLVIESNPKIKEVDFTEEDNIFAVILQHEIDHQNLILISDIGEEIELS